jgi:transposase
MKKIHLEKQKILDILRSMQCGCVRKKAAKLLGVSERTLQKNMNNYDISFRDWKPEKEYKKRKGWGGHKLNMKKAKVIRKLYDNGEEIKNIAKRYDVTFSTISRIVNNITYKEAKVAFGGEAIVNVEYKP